MKHSLPLARVPLFTRIFGLWAGLLLFVMQACSGQEAPAPDRESNENWGTCVISYTYDNSGGFSEIRRSCAFDRRSKLTCGDCPDENKKYDSKKRLIEKTCRVCNLGAKDFDCFDDTDCTGGKPFCDDGKCIFCRSDGDCKTKERPFCSPTGCVQCSSDTGCTDPKAPSCKGGICVACQCTDPGKPNCLKKSDRTVVCVECTENSHCKENKTKPRCDTKTNTCVPGCFSNQDCQTGEICDEGICKECRRDRDCTNVRRPICIEGKCQCEQNNDCPLSYRFCVNKICVECSDTRDCPRGFPACVDGACNLQNCTKDADCKDSNYPSCKPLGRDRVCVGCLKDSDCAAGRTCNLQSFVCE